MPSMRRSVMTKSTSPAALSCAIPSSPLAATSARWPILRTVCASPSRMVSLSSMMRMVAIGRSILPLRGVGAAEMQGEPGAGAIARLEVDAAAMVERDLAHERETEAGALLAGGEERLE